MTPQPPPAWAQLQLDLAHAIPCQFTSLALTTPGGPTDKWTVSVAPLTAAVREKVQAVLTNYPQYFVQIASGRQPLFVADIQQRNINESYAASVASDPSPPVSESMTAAVNSDGSIGVTLFGVADSSTINRRTSAIESGADNTAVSSSIGGAEADPTIQVDSSNRLDLAGTCTAPSRAVDPHCTSPDRAGEFRDTYWNEVINSYPGESCTSGPVFVGGFGRIGSIAGHCAAEQGDPVDSFNAVDGTIASCFTCEKQRGYSGTITGDVALVNDGNQAGGYVYTGDSTTKGTTLAISGSVGGFPAPAGWSVCDVGRSHTPNENCLWNIQVGNTSITTTIGYNTYTMYDMFDFYDPYVTFGDSGGLVYIPGLDGAAVAQGTNAAIASNIAYASNVQGIMSMTNTSVVTCGCGL